MNELPWTTWVTFRGLMQYSAESHLVCLSVRQILGLVTTSQNENLVITTIGSYIVDDYVMAKLSELIVDQGVSMQYLGQDEG